MSKLALLGLATLFGAASPTVAAPKLGGMERWVGTWNVSYTVNLSSCPDAKFGQTKNASLSVGVVDGQLVVKEDVQGSSVTLNWKGDPSKMVLIGRRAATSFVLELDADWQGRRVVAQTVKDGTGTWACTVISDAHVSKR